MWCPHCQHDVELSDSSDRAERQCADCGSLLGAANLAIAARESEVGERETTAERPSWSTWELNEQLRHVERVLAAGRSMNVKLPGGDRLRFDPRRPVPRLPVPPQPARTGMHPLLAFGVWLCVAIGTVALACGSVLAGWGWWAGRAEKWTRGMPEMLVGQFAQKLGLLLRATDSGSRREPVETPFDGLDERLDAFQSRMNNMR